MSEGTSMQAAFEQWHKWTYPHGLGYSCEASCRTSFYEGWSAAFDYAQLVSTSGKETGS